MFALFLLLGVCPAEPNLVQLIRADVCAHWTSQTIGTRSWVLLLARSNACTTISRSLGNNVTTATSQNVALNLNTKYLD